MPTQSPLTDFGHTDLGHMPRRKVSFDPTINLGHVLTFVGFLVAGFGAWSNVDKRVTVIEQLTSAQDVRVKETLSDIKLDVRETKRTVDEIARQQRLPAGR